MEYFPPALENLVEQFEKRMALCREVADYKIRNGMQVLDRNREQPVQQIAIPE